MVKCLYVTASKANYQTNNWIKYKNRDTQSTEYLLSNLACGWTNKYASWYPFDSILLDINWQFWPYFFVLLLAVIKASYDKLYRDHLGKKKKESLLETTQIKSQKVEDLFKCKISNVERFLCSWVCYTYSENNMFSTVQWILLLSIILCCLFSAENQNLMFYQKFIISLFQSVISFFSS